MMDFALLNLVKCTAKIAPNAPPVDDEDWELTEYGKETIAVYRFHQMERILVKNHSNQEQ